MKWNQFLNLVSRMSMDIDAFSKSESKRKLLARFLLFISIGCYCGLRASDLLDLKWGDLLDQKQLVLAEKNTGKVRKLQLTRI